MYSKVILIFLITVLVGLVLFLGGYLLSADDLDQTASLGRLERFTGQNSDSPATAQRRLRRLSTRRVFGPALSEDGKKVLFFETDTGKVVASDFEGKTGEVVSGKILTNAYNALWSPNGYEAILSQRSKGLPGYSYFNLKTGQVTALSTKISDPAWSYHGKKIAYLYFDSAEEKGSISIANPDGTIFSNILSIRIDQLRLVWPKDDLLSFYNRGNEAQSLFVLNLNTNTLTKIFGPVTNLQTLWAPNASKVLLSYDLGQQKKIGYLDLADHSESYFEFLATARQCAWSTNSALLYCGGKENEEQAEGLYTIDTKTEKIAGIFSPSSVEVFHVEQPFLTPTEDFLIFRNGYDQYLYSINLHPVK